MELILLKEIDKNNKSFEDIKHIDENNNEFWYARELQRVLDYKEWRKFEGVIKKAEISCQNSGIDSFDHFVGTDKMVQIGSGAERKQQDYKLSRYAGYLIAQNGDRRKKLLHLHKPILQFKHESKRLRKKNTVCFQKTKKDFIKAI